MYSGGSAGSYQDPNNKFAAMIIHGGANDQVFVNFQQQSIAYRDQLVRDQHFAFLCNHNRGHVIAADAAASIVQFFFDHPYGSVPSPYAGGLPGSFPSYCRP
jgi:hypothetical protein